MFLHKTPKLIQRSFPSLTWRGSNGENSVFLTFDDGPIPGLTQYVLEELKNFKARATFFCVGENVRKHPDIFQTIVGDGHSFGNHTMNHLNGWKTRLEEYVKNVGECQRQFASLGYSRIQHLFRPPYGMITRKQIRALSGEYRIIMWDVLSGDFSRDMNPEKCLKKTISATESGSIVVFHDNLKSERTLRYVLPRYLQHFSEKGFNFLPI